MMRAALAMLALLAATSLAAAQPAYVPKKDRDREHKGPRTRPLPVPGKKPVKLVNLYNTWTHEWLAITPGVTPPRATIDRFFRDHYTNEPTPTEPRLIELLVRAAQHFESETAMVVSAFRHPKYNLLLRKKGRQVARNSQHTKGNAVDFYLPRVPAKRLFAWAKAQAAGGCGLYTGSGFVHMDTGPIRYWGGE